jgi:hypothetical protein
MTTVIEALDGITNLETLKTKNDEVVISCELYSR